MWLVHATFEDNQKLWSGNGWTDIQEMAVRYENPDKAQEIADGLHFASCGFNVEEAKKKESRYVVRDFDTGEAYTPRPFVNNKFIYHRGPGRCVKSVMLGG